MRVLLHAPQHFSSCAPTIRKTQKCSTVSFPLDLQFILFRKFRFCNCFELTIAELLTEVHALKTEKTCKESRILPRWNLFLASMLPNSS